MDRAAAAEAYTRFCRGLIDAVCPYVVAVKPQAACFEALGSDGMRALEEICDYARTAGLFVIVDTKRGDIGHHGARVCDRRISSRETETARWPTP